MLGPDDRVELLDGVIVAMAPSGPAHNLREDCVEVLRAPDPQARCYGEQRVARRGDGLELAALVGASVTVDALLPGR